MSAGNPYQALVDSFARTLVEGAAIDAAHLAPPARPDIAADAPTALIFAPHPDDEVIIGGLPLRLLRELRINVVNVAVTLGSLPERRAERWQELRNCCDYIGFGLVTPDERGLEGINLQARKHNPGQWADAVERVAALLATHRPAIVFAPHVDDWNKTHIGTHHLVVEAMRGHRDLACRWVETEFWGAMSAPNLMVESAASDVADLVAALALHVGEVARNPYHLRMPAWMMDNVRRGAELVGGQGGGAPRFAFATLYRLRHWENGDWRDTAVEPRMMAAGDDLRELFPSASEGS